MRQQFLRHTDGCTSLLLFFSGWGAEPSMFADNTGTRGTYDILMLWDYRDTAFDAKVLDGYTEVRVLGWSMGVWAAGRTLAGLKTAPGKRLAVNGTPFPIHDRTGIPEAVFDGTLDSLSERSLGKFRRRMCG